MIVSRKNKNAQGQKKKPKPQTKQTGRTSAAAAALASRSAIVVTEHVSDCPASHGSIDPWTASSSDSLSSASATLNDAGPVPFAPFPFPLLADPLAAPLAAPAYAWDELGTAAFVRAAAAEPFASACARESFTATSAGWSRTLVDARSAPLESRPALPLDVDCRGKECVRWGRCP